MAFHYSNFGMFGERLKQLADRDGFVPEPGDKRTNFNYPDGINTTWAEHVKLCTAATTGAESALKDWREGNT